MTPSSAGRRALRLGLTGPIGCGKSTIAGWLAEQGAVVIDADRIARDVVERGEPALEQVVAEYGAGVLGPDGSLDRRALARIVFADPNALRRLEGIVRPAVRPRIQRRLADAEAGGAAVVVLEAIGLVDGGYVPDCDEVWLVTCAPDEQLARLERRGVAVDDARRRIAAQERVLPGMQAAATRVIDTGGSLADTRGRVDAAMADALRAFSRRAPAST